MSLCIRVSGRFLYDYRGLYKEKFQASRRGAAVLCTLSVHGSSIDSPKAVFGNKTASSYQAKALQGAFTSATRSSQEIS